MSDCTRCVAEVVPPSLGPLCDLCIADLEDLEELADLVEVPIDLTAFKKTTSVAVDLATEAVEPDANSKSESLKGEAKSEAKSQTSTSSNNKSRSEANKKTNSKHHGEENEKTSSKGQKEANNKGKTDNEDRENREKEAQGRTKPGSSLYGILGVDKRASGTEIRKTYLSLSRIQHPDRGGSTASFQKLGYAYEVLSDPARRARYDHNVLRHR